MAKKNPDSKAAVNAAKPAPKKPAAKPAAKPAPEKIRVGIIGLGRAGFGMQCNELLARADRFEVVAGCDTALPRRKRFQEKFPNAAVYIKAEDLIANPAVEFVSVATRTPTHVELAIKALKAGKTVFCEKPIAVTYADAKKLIAEGKKHPGKLFIRHNRRFEAAFNDIEAIIKSGIIGKVFEIKLRRPNFSRRDDWQTIKKEGGGQLLNWGPHIADHALQFLGTDAKVVFSDLKRIAAVGDAEDHVHILLKNDKDQTVDLEISGGSALGESVYWIFGTKGSLKSDEKTIELKYLDPKAKIPARKPTTGLLETFGTPEKLPWVTETREVRKGLSPECIWDAVFDTVRNGKPFRVTLDEALNVMRVLTEARKGTPFAF